MRKVLFIDDEEEILEIVTFYVKSKLKEVELICCKSSAEAFSFIDQQEIDLIVSDFSIDNFNGFDIYDKVENKKIPFILTTGAIFQEEEDKLKYNNFLKEPQNKVLEKPYDQNDLIALIKDNIF